MRARLLPVIAGIAVLAIVSLLVYGVAAKAPDHGIDQAIGARHPRVAPEFDLAVLPPPIPLARSRGVRAFQKAERDGRVALARLRGTPVVLNIWASWCAPCQTEAPTLRRGWAAAQRAGVLFLGLDTQDVTSDAQAFVEGFKLTYPSVRDHGRDVLSRYGATGIPETYFISAAGRVVAHVPGVISPRQLALGVSAARRGAAVRL